jgi:hypothetical protein
MENDRTFGLRYFMCINGIKNGINICQRQIEDIENLCKDNDHRTWIDKNKQCVTDLENKLGKIKDTDSRDKLIDIMEQVTDETQLLLTDISSYDYET